MHISILLYIFYTHAPRLLPYLLFCTPFCLHLLLPSPAPLVCSRRGAFSRLLACPHRRVGAATGRRPLPLDSDYDSDLTRARQSGMALLVWGSRLASGSGDHSIKVWTTGPGPEWYLPLRPFSRAPVNLKVLVSRLPLPPASPLFLHLSRPLFPAPSPASLSCPPLPLPSPSAGGLTFRFFAFPVEIAGIVGRHQHKVGCLGRRAPPL